MLTDSNSTITFRTYTFEDFPKLDEYWKEQIGLGVMSFYLTGDDEFFLVHIKNCKCCYGEAQSIYWILNKDGDISRVETEEFYQEMVHKQKNIKSLLKFKIPERITKSYLHFSIK